MSIRLADLRSHWQRMLGLLRRGLASLRTRGWRTTWLKVRREIRAVAPASEAPLYEPEQAPFAPFAVPTDASPRASIVIPVYNHVEHTLACLRALAAHPPLASVQVIVVDDGSSDATAEWIAQVSGLLFHRRPRNGGFIAACNDGAELARGDILVFLNNDTIPQPGWLDALLLTFETQPRAGLVGAQLLYPGGRLQEAGGVVFDDGSAWNYGRFESPQDPRFASVRDADYCSGAAIAIKRELFNSLGGFDSRYSPAYYEDTDLAFSVRQAGLRVIYQPAAKVLHLEGITAGTDPGAGIKAYQARNRELFLDKWRSVLASQLPAGTVPGPALLHARQRQVLVVDAMTPRPDHDSASLRMYNLLKLLRQEGAHVVFLESDLHFRGRYTEALRQLGVEVWCRPHARSRAAWMSEHGARFDTVLLSRHYVAAQFVALVRRHAPRARLVFDTVDLHHVREERSARLQSDARLLKAAAATRASELATMAACDFTLVVSEAEQSRLREDAPGIRVEVLSNLHEVAGPGLPFAERCGLLFVGGFHHPPNVDAVLWFGREVMPRLRQALPGVHLHCIGDEPPAAVLELAEQPDVRVHGYVPDLVPAMEGMRVALAPLRFGAGVKGKINLSMAHGQPVVATSCAIEGMHLRDGEDVLVADDPQSFCDAIVRLHNDQTTWDRLSAAGLQNVSRHFSADAARGVVRRVLLDRG